MTILVTGGAGYIGSHTLVELLSANKEVVVLDSFCNSSPMALSRVKDITNKNLRVVEGDVRDFDVLSYAISKFQVESVIHFAGLKAVDDSILNPLEYYENNVYGSQQLFKAMNKYKIKKVVFSSSATVYGDSHISPISESARTGVPTNPYGNTKLIVEEILRDWYKSNRDMSIAILRYFNPVGAHFSGLIGESPVGTPSNLMPYICQTAIGKLKQLAIFGDDFDTPDGTGIRDYIHVCDLAQGHLAALDKCYRNSGVHTYNLGTGTGTSVRELVDIFQNINRVKVNCKVSGRRIGDVASCYADPSKINKDLGWSATRTVADMCKDAWRWQKQNPNGYEKS